MGPSGELMGAEEWGSRERHAPDTQSQDRILIVDVRRFTPVLVRPLLISIVDDLVSMEAPDELIVVSDYECTGLAYELDLRRETRGMFHYECTQRPDGAWVETIRRI